MADRTVKVRLEADISDFVTDIGVKAVAAVNKLERAAGKVDGSLKKTAATGGGIGEGVKAGTTQASAELDKLATKADKTMTAAGAKARKTAKEQFSKAGAEASEEFTKATKKTLPKAGEDAGKSFGAGFKKWLTGGGGGPMAELGKSGGTVFGSGFLGALKTPILGPIILGALIAAVAIAAPAAGAVAGAGLVSGFGAGIATLGLVFAAKSVAVKNTWNRTLWSMAADMKVLSKPFESTLTQMALVARSTFAKFKPALQDAFRLLGPTLTTFGQQLGQAFAELAPAVRPLATAFADVLSTLGPAAQDAIRNISQGLQDLSASVSANPTALADLTRGIGELTRMLLDGITILNNINGAFERLTGGISLVDVVMGGLKGQLTVLLGPFAVLEKALDAVGLKADQMNSSVEISAETTKLWTQGLTAGQAAAVGVSGALAGAAPAVESLATKFERQWQATQKANEALHQQSNLLLALAGSEIGFQAALDAATASIKENGRTHDINTAKGRANKQALLDVAAAAKTQYDAMINNNEGVVAAARTAESARANFVKLAVQMGYSVPVAKAMAKSMIDIPNVSRTAKLNANIADLETKLATAKAKLKDPKLTAEQKAKLNADISKLQAGIAAAKAALASVPASKTVNVTVNTFRNMIETVTHQDKGVRVNADGGFYPSSVPSYANGKLPNQAMIAPGKGRGLVQWAEGETGGEAFIPLAPSKRDRSEKILGKVADEFGYGLVKSFANGGFNLPGGRLVDIALILRQLGIPFDPAAGVNFTSSLAAANRANRAAAPARAAATRADAAEQAAMANVARLQRAITLQQRYVTSLRQQGASDARIRAEQKETIGLQDQLYRAKLRVTAATKASNAADAVYKVRADAAAKATEAHKAAIEKLIEQQKAAVELADQVSSGLTSGANIGDLFQKSLTGKGLLADLQGKGAELGKFGTLITALRKRGLDEDLIQQIIGKGAGQGTGLAQAILNGGLALINALNKAQSTLEQQANLIGAGVANAQYGVKIAGARASGGGVTKGMTYRVDELGQEWFTAPLNGLIAPAGVDPRRYVQGLASGGGGGYSRTREVHVHQNNYFTGVSMAEADLIAQRANAKAELAAKGY